MRPFFADIEEMKHYAVQDPWRAGLTATRPDGHPARRPPGRTLTAIGQSTTPEGTVQAGLN